MFLGQPRIPGFTLTISRLAVYSHLGFGVQKPKIGSIQFCAVFVYVHFGSTAFCSATSSKFEELQPNTKLALGKGERK